MNDDTTQNMGRSRSFELGVFARFEALDFTLQGIDTNLQKLEAKTYDTKPIWEQALAEILAMSRKLDTVERKLKC